MQGLQKRTHRSWRDEAAFWSIWNPVLEQERVHSLQKHEHSLQKRVHSLQKRVHRRQECVHSLQKLLSGGDDGILGSTYGGLSPSEWDELGVDFECIYAWCRFGSMHHGLDVSGC